MADAAHNEPLRLVFFGTSEFALPALNLLVENGPHRNESVALVISAPPAPAGRGRKLTPSPVAQRAGELGLELFETNRLKSPEAFERFAAAKPQLSVVAAYGAFLPESFLNFTKVLPLNIHPSLLPRHRGAAPVNWTLISGDREAGVSVIFLNKDMDAGAILKQHRQAVPAGLSAGELEAAFAQIGAALLLEAIDDYKSGALKPLEQDPALVTINRLLTKKDGQIDWGQSAAMAAARINGVTPWPGAQTYLNGRLVKLFGAEPAPGQGQPGQVLGLTADGRLLVAAGQGAVGLKRVQPEGKKCMDAADYFRGYQPKVFTPAPGPEAE